MPRFRNQWIGLVVWSARLMFAKIPQPLVGVVGVDDEELIEAVGGQPRARPSLCGDPWKNDVIVL